MEVADRGRIADARQVIPELAQVVHAAPGPDLLPCGQRQQRRVARLLRFSGRKVGVREHHRGEKVAADEPRIVSGPGAAAGIKRGVLGPFEVAQAVPEFGGQFGLVEYWNQPGSFSGFRRS